MVAKQDSCRLNNTESFLSTVSCNFDIVESIFFISKGIPPNKHAEFCLLSLFFALNIHRVYIQFSDDALLLTCFKKALFK